MVEQTPGTLVPVLSTPMTACSGYELALPTLSRLLPDGIQGPRVVAQCLSRGADAGKAVAREADDHVEPLTSQMPFRCRSRSSEGLFSLSGPI